MNTRAVEMAQQIKYFWIKCEDSSPDTQNPYTGQAGMVAICNLSIGKAEVGVP